MNHCSMAAREGFGAALLEDGATPFEVALSDVEAGELLSLNAEAIVQQWNPWEVPSRNLKVLAFAMGVTLWDDAWPELTKRRWIADQWLFKAKRGTEQAIRMALDLWGYSLVEVLTPPQGFYASKEFTAAERNAWLGRMPQIRLSLVAAQGIGPVNEWFAGQAYAGEAFAVINDGAVLYGRRGVLRRDGVDTPLQSVVLNRTVTTQTAVDVERVDVPGVSSIGLFAGEDFAGDERFAGAAEMEASTLTVSLDRQFDVVSDTLGLTFVEPGLEPVDMRYERLSDIGAGGGAFFAGHDCAGQAFAVPDDAGSLIADVLRLLDPSVAAPMTDGISFAGHDRVGMPVNTAEVMIDLHQVMDPDAWAAGESFAGQAFATVEDVRPAENAFQAVMAAKALRDTVLVSFAPRRPLQFRDRIGSATKAGDWVPDQL